MSNNPTIKEVGQLFKDNGYILSDYGIMQFNTYTNQFEYVQDNEVLEIFRRVYPNFERRVLKVGMIEKYLPVISEREFSIYDYVKDNNKPFDEAKLIKGIKKIVEYNNSRKKPVDDIIPGDDYLQCMQFLINNDIYTDHTLLYRYTDNDFKSFGLNEVRHIFKDVIMDRLSTDDISRLVYIGLNDLTYITDVKEDLDRRRFKRSITEDNWNTYNRINDLIKQYKEYIDNDQ